MAAGKADVMAILNAAGMATACIDEEGSTPVYTAKPMSNKAGF